MNITRVGNSIIPTPTRDLILNNVLHVPTTHKNLISIHRFTLTMTLLLNFTTISLSSRIKKRGGCFTHFEPIHFGYGIYPHRGDRFPHITSFPAGGSFTHFEPIHLGGPRFLCRGSRSTQPSGEVQTTVKTCSGRMVKCWIPKIYLTNPSTEPLTFSHLV
jgi:hypothetical protein